MICLQCVCFGSYLFANLLLYIEIILFSLVGENKNQQHARIVMSIWILNEFLLFVTQTSLILIFLEIGKNNPFKVSVETTTRPLSAVSGKAVSERY